MRQNLLPGFRVMITILFLSFILLGCTDKGDPEAVGNIKGKVFPENAAVNVLAAPTFGINSITMTVNAAGEFSVDNVPPGEYVITANPAAGYGPPPAVQTNVTTNNTADLGTIQMTTIATTGSVSFTLDGTSHTIVPPLAFAAYNSPNFSIGSKTGAANTNHFAVNIALNNVNGPGSYTLANNLSSTIRILQYAGSTTFAWSTLKGGAGTVNITTINSTTRTCSGTFTVNATAENVYTAGSKAISNGVFTNLGY